MYRTHAVTFRPTDGITDDDLKNIDTWAAKSPTCAGILIGVEKEGESRHCHLAILMTKPTNISNMKTTLLAALKSGATLDADEKRLTPAEIAVFRKGFHPWYSHDWVENYIGADRDHKTGDQYTCYRNTLPADLDELAKFYPPKDDKQLKKPVGIKYLRWEKLLLEEHGFVPSSWDDKAFDNWLIKHMCYDRDIEPITDVRRRKQEAAFLALYVRKTGTPLDFSKYTL